VGVAVTRRRGLVVVEGGFGPLDKLLAHGLGPVAAAERHLVLGVLGTLRAFLADVAARVPRQHVRLPRHAPVTEPTLAQALCAERQRMCLDKGKSKRGV
jgi:hypothetical protein